MKLTLTCVILLILTVAATVAIGYRPTEARWGTEGVTNLFVVAAICLMSALVALIPLVLVSLWHPDQIGAAGLAATVIRLFLTMGALVAYQIIKDPQMASFIFWSPIFYLLLLAIETTFGVLFVRRYYRPSTSTNEGAIS